MCGIIGVIGKSSVTSSLVDGLRRLEYRGYDSAGVATLVEGRIERRRSEGKLDRLVAVLDKSPLDGVIGIGHTRWATHGVPNERNAHPHAAKNVAVVHNGIVENYRELAAELRAKGHSFASDTDTEVVAHLISQYMDEGMGPQEAAAASLKRLHGAFSLAILFTGREDLLIGARLGAPLAVGWGDGEMFMSSDALALAPLTQKISYLAEGDWVELTREGAVFHDVDDRIVERPIKLTAYSGAMIGKGNHAHFMMKEIFEQPAVIGETLNAYFNPASRTITIPNLPWDWNDLSRVTIIACGSSYYAAMVAKYWFEQVARLPVEIDIASEFRYREAPMPDGGMALFISQSGETADTLAALRYCKQAGQHIASILNVSESSMARESDIVFPTLAGPEIGVASTKAFTCQLVTLACLAIHAGVARGAIDHADEARLSSAITKVPEMATEILNNDATIRALAENIHEARDVLYIGRGLDYPIALEGALKLKEISYIHAEGYAAGELKHGPIALVDKDVPIIVIAPSGALFDKTASNLQQVSARGGRVIFLSDRDGIAAVGHDASAVVELPKADPFVTPILYAIPVQLLAYHVAIMKGTDVDQPRNLAKSVTVE
ncbi:glutamine--fructose-6-phosphate transaminase (isomerizing) [Oceanibacterium hippocampi]|uniref:Glutamine--fructose-6-phosphate aminotransferase [isomerizing] n=1 Tax=Oceanibacterium hippocampi TaxID=745714 RepID=A0A1Y5T6H5_9PROT|nr:glutamine--fructose-6-phosphate transaminase (isomerizing) [Oceanibacterium hippocampi]SLN56632.1 Glutamine--fructose-6-phosphate aminotransferase [isomerizing] [Oceanibacterium hippocampi]